MTVDSRKKNMHTWWQSQDLIGNSQLQLPADKDDFGWHQFLTNSHVSILPLGGLSIHKRCKPTFTLFVHQNHCKLLHTTHSLNIYIYSIEVIACIWTFPPLTWLQQNPTNILVMNNGWSNPSRVDTSQEVHNPNWLPSNIFFICIISQWWTYHHHLLVLYNWKDLCFIMFQLWIYQMDIWHLIYVQGFKHDYSLEHNHFYAPITSKGTHPSRHSAPLVPLQHLTCKGKKYHENPEISVVNGQDFS